MNSKKHSIYRVGNYAKFQVSPGGCGAYPLWIRRDSVLVKRNFSAPY